LQPTLGFCFKGTRRDVRGTVDALRRVSDSDFQQWDDPSQSDWSSLHHSRARIAADPEKENAAGNVPAAVAYVYRRLLKLTVLL
jgi:hypothetical protein